MAKYNWKKNIKKSIEKLYYKNLVFQQIFDGEFTLREVAITPSVFSVFYFDVLVNDSLQAQFCSDHHNYCSFQLMLHLSPDDTLEIICSSKDVDSALLQTDVLLDSGEEVFNLSSLTHVGILHDYSSYSEIIDRNSFLY